MSKKCYSCAIPLKKEGMDPRGNYCHYCCDDQGNLLPRDQVQKSIAAWLAGWAPKESSADFIKRAENYMKAMPVWAQE